MRSSVKPYLYLSQDRASILVIAIWVLVFFSILCVGIYRGISSQVNLARAMEERMICPYLAKSACLYAQIKEQEDETGEDSFSELRQKREKVIGKGKFIYTQTDEDSKVNINTVSSDIVGRLPELSPELAQKIAASALNPFKLKEEVLLINGVTQEKFAKFKDFITVYTDGKININTVSLEVLKALGLDEGVINTILSFRLGSDGKEDTEDDGVFKSTAEIIPQLRIIGGFSQAQEAQLVSLISQGILKTNSDDLTLQVQTQIYLRLGLKYTIVLDKDKIKEWREF